MRSGGKVLDFEEADPDTDTFGIGKVEDLTWKGFLDLGTCTEVRPPPVRLPGLGHREGPVAQAAHPRPARPRVRQGPLPAGPRGPSETAMEITLNAVRIPAATVTPPNSTSSATSGRAADDSGRGHERDPAQRHRPPARRTSPNRLVGGTWDSRLTRSSSSPSSKPWRRPSPPGSWPTSAPGSSRSNGRARETSPAAMTSRSRPVQLFRLAQPGQGERRGRRQDACGPRAADRAHRPRRRVRAEPGARCG